jgi:hypothetical protein
MKITLKQLERLTIEDFADKHNLTMVVVERQATKGLMPFYAEFEGSEVIEHHGAKFIGSLFGDGWNPDEAIKDYAKKLSNKVLVFNSFSKTDRKEIECPKFI